MPARRRASPLVQLLGYYLVVGLAIAVLVRAFPWLGRMLAMDFGEAVPALEQFQGALERPGMLLPGLGPLTNTALIVFLAMLGGLLFAFPVAWVYTVSKREEGYDKSVVQMVIILPIAVAGVVLVVRGDVALAFALAGIVAAVRFRTTLKDVKDAVFAFVAIGIGLASGIQAWLIAGVLSLVFSVIILGLWMLEVGEEAPVPAMASGPFRLSEALAPGAGSGGAVAVGDDALTAPLAPDEVEAARGWARRVREYVRADAMRGKGRYKHLLLVHATRPEPAEELVDELLDDYGKRWRLVDVVPGRSGTSVLEFLVRFKKKAEIAEFLDRLGEAAPVRAVELTAIPRPRDLAP